MSNPRRRSAPQWWSNAPASSAIPALHMVQLPPVIRISTKLFALLLVVSLFSALFLPWQQTAAGTGRVIAFDRLQRDQIIEAPIKGRVVAWHVKEGDTVNEGQLIAEIADNDPLYTQRLSDQRDAVREQRDQARQAIDEIERQITSITQVRELTLDSMDAKLKMARNEVQGAELAVQGAEGKRKVNDLNFARVSELADRGLVSERDREVAESKAVTARAELFEKKAKLQEKRAKVLSIRAERESKASDFDAKLSEVRAKLSEARAKRAKASESLSKAEVKLAQQLQQRVTSPASRRDPGHPRAGWRQVRQRGRAARDDRARHPAASRGAVDLGQRHAARDARAQSAPAVRGMARRAV